MDEPLKCECGQDKLLYFGEFLRCPFCLIEFKKTGRRGKREFWQRRYNLKLGIYDRNWEKVNYESCSIRIEKNRKNN